MFDYYSLSPRQMNNEPFHFDWEKKGRIQICYTLKEKKRKRKKERKKEKKKGKRDELIMVYQMLCICFYKKLKE